MFTRELTTANPTVKLIKPDVERDAPLGVEWMAGPQGRATLKLMGVADKYNHPTTLEQEHGRVQNFLDNDDYYWMIQSAGNVVGAAWVYRHDIPQIAAPAIGIMIGDPSARSQGIGQAAFQAIINFLRREGSQAVRARHTMENQASAAMLTKLGFVPDGNPYTEEGGEVTWQNMLLKND